MPIRLVVRTSENPFSSSSKRESPIKNTQTSLRASRPPSVKQAAESENTELEQKRQDTSKSRRRKSAVIVLKSARAARASLKNAHPKSSSDSSAMKPSVLAALKSGRAKKVMPRHLSKKAAFAQRSRSYKR